MNTQNSATHTPGPWTYGFTEKSGMFADIFSRDSFPNQTDRDAKVHIATVYTVGADDANARLISAAPDLLAALEGVMEQLMEGGTVNLLAGQKARTAIAKAKGGAL